MRAGRQLCLPPMPAPPAPPSFARLVLLVVAAEGLLTLMDAMIKGLSARYPDARDRLPALCLRPRRRLRLRGLGAAGLADAGDDASQRPARAPHRRHRHLVLLRAGTPAAGGRHRPLLHLAGADRAARRAAAGRAARLAHRRGAGGGLCRHAADRRRQPRRQLQQRCTASAPPPCSSRPSATRSTSSCCATAPRAIPWRTSCCSRTSGRR